MYSDIEVNFMSHLLNTVSLNFSNYYVQIIKEAINSLDIV